MTCVACAEAHSSVLHFGAAPDTSRGAVTVVVPGIIGLMVPGALITVKSKKILCSRLLSLL